MSLKFCEIRLCPTELAALERLKKSHRLTMEKILSSHFSAIFHLILFILAGNEDMLKAWMSSKFGKIRPLVSIATDSVII